MRWKWILGIVLAAFVVVLVVAYIIAASYDYNSLKPLITDMTKEYTGRELTLGGDIDLKIGLPPTLEVNEVTFQNAAWGSQPQMAQIKYLQVKVALLPLLKGDVTLKRLILLEPKFMLEVNKSGQTNLDFEAPKEAKPQKTEDKPNDKKQTLFEIEKVEIKDGEIIYKDHKTGKTETVEIASLKLQEPLLGDGANIDIKGSYNKTPFQVTGNIGLLSKALKSKEKWPLKLEAQAVKTTVSVEGSIQDLMNARGINLKLNVEGEDLAQFEKLTGEPLPVKGPFRFSANVVSPSEKEVQVSDLIVVLGESQIQGIVNLTRAAKRPQIEAKLTSKKLDLRPIMAEKKASGGTQKQTTSAGTKKDKVFPAQTFDLKALQQIDAKISLDVDQIIGLISALDNLHLEINLQNGHLIMQPLTADIGGGKFSGTLELVTRANQASLKTKISAQKINLGEMVKKMGVSKDIEGILDLDIDLAGHGNSVAALMAGLNGHFIASVDQGKMPVKYLNLVGADLSSSLLKMVNPFEEKIDQAQINCAVCALNIKDGMANGDAIILDDPQKTLISQGTLNLKTEELDFGIQTKPKGGIGTKETGKINISLSEITKPFKLGGTLANPSLGISVERTVSILGKALLGPGGIASLFVSGSYGDQNPCVVALQKAKEQPANDQTKSGKETATESPDDKKKEGLGSKIKNLFSKPKE
ncbi:MAG: AsmA family protein [Desulfobacterales bacterium]